MGNTNCSMPCDMCPCEPNATPPPPKPTYVQDAQRYGATSGGVWDTTLDRSGIQPIHS